MGIRFYCPNGHKLHVKAFLAGKRGICPHCEARFLIPLQSQIAPRSRPFDPELSTEGRADVSQSDSPPQLAVDEAEPQVATDPIAEASDAVWYVRPPGGGQYGPARGDVMRRWIEEHRVCPDSLVWREGWEDWKLGGRVFPGLSDPLNGPPPTLAIGIAPSAQSLMAGDVGPQVREVPRLGRKTGGRRRSIAAIVLLGLILVTLLFLLARVLQQSGRSRPAASAASTVQGSP
jgi:hypothetical protein